MKNLYAKLLTAFAAISCPAAFAAVAPKARVPEGGSTALYLLCAGIVTIGAIFIRSKSAKVQQL